MNDVIKGEITPTIERISNETGDDIDSIFAEVEECYEKNVSMGIGEEDAAKMAMGTVRTSYSKIKRLGLAMFEGFFIGSTASRDANDYNRKQCQSLLDEFTSQFDEDYNWKPEAMKAGLIDITGALIYSQQYIDEYRNGADNMKWMIGKKLDVKMGKTAYGMFRRHGTEDEFEFFTCYIDDPDSFVPEFNKLYKFRAAHRNPAKSNLTFYKGASKLIELATLDMEYIESKLNVLSENIKDISAVYDYDIPMAIKPESPNPKFWIANAIIGSFETTGYGETKIAVIDQFADFDAEEIVMNMPTEYAAHIHEGAVGILVFSPFIRFGKESKGEIEGAVIPSGNVLGFIPDPKHSPDFTMEIEEDYQEEY